MLREDRRKGDGDWPHKTDGQHRIGRKRRESVVNGRKEGAKRRETREESLIGESVMIGQNEEAKRRETEEEKLIGWGGWKMEAGERDRVVIGQKERTKRERVWGGDTRFYGAAGRREGRMRAPAEPTAGGAQAEGCGGDRPGWGEGRRGARCPTTKSGHEECRWRSWQGEGKRRWDWWQDGSLQRRLVADPAGDLRDG
jgi:hypothetical protein